MSMEWSQYCVVMPVGWNRYQLTVVWSGIAILGVRRPRRVLVSRQRRLYSNPGICAVVIPVCPSCL